MSKKILLIFSFLVVFNSFAQKRWYSILKFNSNQIKLILDFKRDSLFLSIPEQKANNLIPDTFKLNSRELSFSYNKISVEFKGIFKNDSIVGVFNQKGLSIPLTWHNKEVFKKYTRPQTPQGPFDYLTEEVVIRNKKDNINLSATYTKPKTGKKFNTIVLLSGSGAQDRNEEIFGHQLFKVIADFFTNKGYAVLRFDDRGAGKSEGNYYSSTMDNFANDALSVVSYIKKRKDVKDIGFICHSEGGFHSLIAQQQEKEIDFMVWLACPAISGIDVHIDQIERILIQQGKKGKELDSLLSFQKKIDNLIQADDTLKVKKELIRQFSTNNKDSLEVENEIYHEYSILKSEWYRSFIQFEPELYLKYTSTPILALYTEKDIQVNSTKNINKIKHYPLVDTYEFEDLNHMFQHCKTGMLNEYASIEQTISIDVLNYIFQWLEMKTK